MNWISYVLALAILVSGLLTFSVCLVDQDVMVSPGPMRERWIRRLIYY